MKISIGIVGCAGRMGRMLIQSILQDKECSLSGGTESNKEFIDKDIGLLVGNEKFDCNISNDPEALFNNSDVVIDFTNPIATKLHASIAAETHTPLVIGTTGLTVEDDKQIVGFSNDVSIVKSSNFSIGINIIQSEVEKISGILGSDFDAEVLEMHHRNKVDAPSGTAIDLGKSIAKGREVLFSDVAKFSREGETGERSYGEIGFATLRGGEVVGDHTVIFSSASETIKLSHNAHSRSIFSLGAVCAAKWAISSKPGLYTMKDVLSI